MLSTPCVVFVVTQGLHRGAVGVNLFVSTSLDPGFISLFSFRLQAHIKEHGRKRLQELDDHKRKWLQQKLARKSRCSAESSPVRRIIDSSADIMTNVMAIKLAAQKACEDKAAQTWLNNSSEADPDLKSPGSEDHLPLPHVQVDDDRTAFANFSNVNQSEGQQGNTLHSLWHILKNGSLTDDSKSQIKYEQHQTDQDDERSEVASDTQLHLTMDTEESELGTPSSPFTAAVATDATLLGDGSGGGSEVEVVVPLSPLVSPSSLPSAPPSPQLQHSRSVRSLFDFGQESLPKRPLSQSTQDIRPARCQPLLLFLSIFGCLQFYLL